MCEQVLWSTGYDFSSHDRPDDLCPMGRLQLNLGRFCNYWGIFRIRRCSDVWQMEKITPLAVLPSRFLHFARNFALEMLLISTFATSAACPTCQRCRAACWKATVSLPPAPSISASRVFTQILAFSTGTGSKASSKIQGKLCTYIADPRSSLTQRLIMWSTIERSIQNLDNIKLWNTLIVLSFWRVWIVLPHMRLVNWKSQFQNILILNSGFCWTKKCAWTWRGFN